MRKSLTSLVVCTISALAAMGCAMQVIAAVGGGTASVTFVNPEQFTDFRGSGHVGKLDRDALMEDLRQFIQREANETIPAGRELEVRILDINDAGTTNNLKTETRVTRDLSPATVDLEYRLREGDRTIASGKEYVTGMTAPVGRTTRPDATMPAVKNALHQWMQSMAPK